VEVGRLFRAGEVEAGLGLGKGLVAAKWKEGVKIWRERRVEEGRVAVVMSKEGEATCARAGTNDEVEMGRVMGMIGEVDWKEIEERVAQIKIRGEGVYVGEKRKRSWSGVGGVLGWLVVGMGVVTLLVWGKVGVVKVHEGAVGGRVHMDWGR
jgi:hypothetical protein